MSAFAQDMKPIQLPDPVKTGGKPLMECLAQRHSSREFKTDVLPTQQLSNLLWAAFGVNREDGRRTAPSAMNVLDMEIYVFLSEGIYLYDTAENRLEGVLSGDHRASAGEQEFVKDAPLNLAYVSDYAKMGDRDEEMKSSWASSHAGFISQNVYLYCASEGLSTVVRAWVDKEACAELLNLRPEQKIILTQTIGYPVE